MESKRSRDTTVTAALTERDPTAATTCASLSGAPSLTVTLPFDVMLTPSGALSNRNAGTMPSVQPRASATWARNAKLSPGRISLCEGRTSMRAGGPGERQAAFTDLEPSSVLELSSGGGALAAGRGAAACVAVGALVGAGAPATMRRKARLRRALAVQFCPLITNWY